jgi:hypothetical protein
MDVENSKLLEDQIKNELQDLASQQKKTLDRVRRPEESSTRRAKRVSK